LWNFDCRPQVGRNLIAFSPGTKSHPSQKSKKGGRPRMEEKAEDTKKTQSYEENASVRIQSCWRGLKARRKVSALLNHPIYVSTRNRLNKLESRLESLEEKLALVDLPLTRDEMGEVASKLEIFAASSPSIYRDVTLPCATDRSITLSALHHGENNFAGRGNLNLPIQNLNIASPAISNTRHSFNVAEESQWRRNTRRDFSGSRRTSSFSPTARVNGMDDRLSFIYSSQTRGLKKE